VLAIAADNYSLQNELVADMDGDGDLDVVAIGNTGKLVWFENYSGSIVATPSLPPIAEDSGLTTEIIFRRQGDIATEQVFNFQVLGSSTFGTDYTVSGATSFTPTTGSITFLAGERTVTIVVTPVADGDFEGDELIRIRTAFYADIGLPEQDDNPTDAVITILRDEPQDFGDAPDTFHTSSGNNDASHGAGGPALGATRDAEADGQPTANADGDGSDDDGVTVGTIHVGQQDAIITVNVQNAPTGARLDAWFDFDGDGNFAGAWEQVAVNLAVVNGDNQIKIDVPSAIASGEVVARFRLSTHGGISYLGHAIDGEVEDYMVTISPTASSEGIFSERPPISTAATSAQDVVMADLDGDGDLDVIAADGNSLDWYENLGSEQFAAHEIALSGSRSVKVVDLDRDGDLDLIAGIGGFIWYENDGNQAFAARTTNLGNVPPIEEFHTTDLDGDGDLDIVGCSGQSFSSGQVFWLKNDGSQNFSAMIPIASTSSAISVALGDVNGDGFIDIVTGMTSPPSSGFPKITCLLNDGFGNFTQGFTSFTVPNIASLYVTDLDGDGDRDILFSFTSFNFGWLENLGVGVFSSNYTTAMIDSTTAFSSVVPADMDGDGDMDILATAATTHKAYWYRKDGAVDPSFTRIEIGTTGRSPWSIFPGDLDGDGDMDVVTASRSDHRIEWFENIPANAGDFDGDGDVDGRDMLAWQRGQTPSPLSSSDLADWRVTYGYIAPVPAVAGDFDGDGDVDGRDFLTWQRSISVGLLSDWQNNYDTSSPAPVSGLTTNDFSSSIATLSSEDPLLEVSAETYQHALRLKNQSFFLNSLSMQEINGKLDAALEESVDSIMAHDLSFLRTPPSGYEYRGYKDSLFTTTESYEFLTEDVEGGSDEAAFEEAFAALLGDAIL
jgi:hypothetical protein